MEKQKIFLEIDYLKNNATLFLSSGETKLMHMGQAVDSVNSRKKLNLFLSFNDTDSLNLASNESNVKKTVGTFETKNIDNLLKNWNDKSFRNFEINQLGQYKRCDAATETKEDLEPYFIFESTFIRSDIWFEKNSILFRDAETYSLDKYSEDGYNVENDIKIETNLKTPNEKYLFLKQFFNKIDRTAFLSKPEDFRAINEEKPIFLKSLSNLYNQVKEKSENKDFIQEIEKNVINRQKNKIFER